MTNELWRLGAADLAEAIRNGDASSRDVVTAHLERIAEVNPKINAVTLTLADQALAEAQAADSARAAGRELGPLHGVPFSVKENIDLAGSATTQGMPVMAEAIPEEDAPHLANLRAAGAIPFARTNLPEFGFRWHTDNALRGSTKNPWDSTRTPGGSSGGEAAALATGMTPLGLGNDYGGSLRWPSQCNGTAALKPTLGRIPNHSSLSEGEPPPTIQLYAVEGPMARHVRDLRLAFEAMAVGDRRDPWWAPAPIHGPEVAKRVALTIDPGSMGVDPAVAAGVRRAADALRDAGYQVDEVEPPSIPEALDAWTKSVMTEVMEYFWPLLEPIVSDDLRRFISLVTTYQPPVDLPGYLGVLAVRNGIAREWRQFMADYPLVLGPVSCSLPFEVGADLASVEDVGEIIRSLRLVTTGNLLGLPVCVVNAGVEGGLPQGVQLIGDRYREDICLDAGEAIEDRLGIVTPIDPR